MRATLARTAAGSTGRQIALTAIVRRRREPATLTRGRYADGSA